MVLTLGFICFIFFTLKTHYSKLKRLKLLCLGSMAILLMNCSGGSGNGSQEKEAQNNEVQSNQTQSKEEAASPSPELEQKLETGKNVYNQYCLACHQADGAGVAGAFPPLKESDWVAGDKNRLISVVINGLEGPIEVNGQQYNSMMPSQGFLADEQIAAVLTYVRKSFGNDAEEIMVEEVKAVRDKVQADSAVNK